VLERDTRRHSEPAVRTPWEPHAGGGGTLLTAEEEVNVLRLALQKTCFLKRISNSGSGKIEKPPVCGLGDQRKGHEELAEEAACAGPTMSSP